jgi:hypothetical protein
MVHPLVEQLKFTRTEVVRAMAGVTVEEATQRFPPMNCLSWIVGHLANQEQRYWLTFQGSQPAVPGLDELVGFGKPASTPPFAEMWEAWNLVGAATEAFLNGLTGDDMLKVPAGTGRMMGESTGTLMALVIYHQWFHIGESQAIRQLQGAADLGTFVGDLGGKAPYRAEV